ncbi:ATPase AAA [Jannaschia pagri]|uniref:ATPase AAA n=1 Tax=Jannaschia pagri TaxID=2829797 RepID=A0ABQ4NK43_9RHOB|nr:MULTISPECIES: hypothetical protein [unclassified Jannaschia]GIT90880.1 ATPase AAA [Jannaschia sp. AI_61]GIT94711.1 ATPase AAA [Jannaschia sp. AI_62]
MPCYVTPSQAALRLRTARRVMIVGRSGGGKTTLALRLSEQFKLPHYALDRDVIWLPGWHLRPKAEQRVLIQDLAARDRWIIDGSSPSSFDLRVPRADLILWVRIPRARALWQLAGRVLRHYGRVRPAMADGCPEPLPDLAFLSYVWNFDRDHAPRFLTEIDAHGPTVPVAVLRSRADMARLVCDAAVP